MSMGRYNYEMVRLVVVTNSVIQGKSHHHYNTIKSEFDEITRQPFLLYFVHPKCFPLRFKNQATVEMLPEERRACTLLKVNFQTLP